jgi:hypothetical protein
MRCCYLYFPYPLCVADVFCLSPPFVLLNRDGALEIDEALKPCAVEPNVDTP